MVAAARPIARRRRVTPGHLNPIWADAIDTTIACIGAHARCGEQLEMYNVCKLDNLLKIPFWSFCVRNGFVTPETKGPGDANAG
jgi:hypothetical protein